MIEGSEEMNNSGVLVVGLDAPSDHHVSPTPEPDNKKPIILQSITNQLATCAPSYPAASPPAGATPVPEKKKRGRPRKYRPDWSIRKPLSPKPISSAAPPVIDFSTGKRAKIRSPVTGKHDHQHPPKGG